MWLAAEGGRVITDSAGDTIKGGDLIKRHRLVTRLWHWLNAVVLAVMLMSGLMIFNAHSRLYWGQEGFDRGNAWLVLGRFPGWITIPSHYSLADARLWHLSFGWLLVGALAFYLIWSLIAGHLRRNIVPRLAELDPAHLWHDIKEHARLRFPTGAAALQYNVLQKLAYGSVLLVMLPGIILTGLTMSPGMNAAWPWLLDLFGGRQSARSLHFIFAFGLVGFFVVHIAMVVLAGPINEVRSMITGWYRLPREREEQS